MANQTLTSSLLAFSALVLMSCNTVNGKLQVQNALPVVVNGTNQQILPGTYDAKVEVAPFTYSLVLSINFQGKNSEVKFKVPLGREFPRTDGNFSLAASESRQPFDVNADLRTSVVDSAESSGVESCSRLVAERVCGPRGCATETHTFYGNQYVRYIFRETTKHISADFTKLGNAADHLATFGGARTESQKVYTFQDYCH